MTVVDNVVESLVFGREDPISIAQSELQGRILFYSRLYSIKPLGILAGTRAICNRYAVPSESVYFPNEKLLDLKGLFSTNLLLLKLCCLDMYTA